MYTIEEFDKTKTKILKYIFYKKRTEKEIKQKFSSSVDENLLDDVIENLKELGYINDLSYVERSVNEFIAINTLSIKEIKYKLYSKGVESNLIEDYISNNIEELKEYELNCARKIFYKKQNNMEYDDIVQYLKKKGYTSETINNIEE